MALVSIIAAGIILYVLGRFLARSLGWPRDVEGALKWGFALLATAVLATGLPDLVDHWGPRVGMSGAVDAGELVAVLVVLGLGVVGYVAWLRGQDGGRTDGQRLLPRRRALPPPPAGGPADDEGFTLLEPPGDG